MAQNININETVEAWADIVIKNWHRKITELEIGVTHQLYDSLSYSLQNDAAGMPQVIEFVMNYYGRFVDMGVGKGVTIGNLGIVQTKRKPKPWYSKELYSQVNKLAEILADKYSMRSVHMISEHINDYNTVTIGIK